MESLSILISLEEWYLLLLIRDFAKGRNAHLQKLRSIKQSQIQAEDSL